MSGPTPAGWLTPWRMRVYPTAVFAAMVLSLLFTWATSSGASTLGGRLGGDYPAFYGTGRMLLDGRSADLYDWTVQTAYQTDLNAGAEGVFLPFPYPPVVALPYVLLALLPYGLSYVVHTAGMALALYAGIRLVAPMLPWLRDLAFPAFAMSLAFWPAYRAATGAQNTLLTLLLLAAVWRALHERRDAWAGVAVGLLLYKPQFGVPLIGLCFVAGRWRTLPTVAATAAVLYGLSAAVYRPDWPIDWMDQATRFYVIDQDVNKANGVGWLGFLEAVLGWRNPVALGLGYALTGATVLALVAVWWRDRVPLDVRFGLTATGMVLLPPHAMFYDAGLVLVTLAVAVHRGVGRPVIAALWAGAFAGVFAKGLGFSPVFFVVLGCAALGARLAWTHRRERTGEP